MNCSPDLVQALLDGELDAAETAEIERHLSDCAECAEAYSRLREQKARIRQQAPYYNAPPGLEGAIVEALAREGGDAGYGTKWRFAAIAASVLLVISAAWNVLQLRSSPERDAVSEEVFAEHIRSLMGTRLVDVESSDRHTVKPWFAGKLDFSPEVRDLAGDGFPLVGGRVDYLDGRRVAALVYRRAQHVITVFIWPAGSSSGTAVLSREGYHVVHWTAGQMTYWAVSDVAANELERLRGLLSR